MINFTSPYGSIDLPDPILGDSEQLNVKTIFNFCMLRRVHSTKRTLSHSVLNLLFAELTTTQKDAFVTFLKGSRGQNSVYTDYDSVAWTGTIIGDPFEFTHVGTKNVEVSGYCELQDVWSITIQFEAINL